MGRHFLLQGIFLSQDLNLCLLHCRQILYCLSHQGSPLRCESKSTEETVQRCKREGELHISWGNSLKLPAPSPSPEITSEDLELQAMQAETASRGPPFENLPCFWWQASMAILTSSYPGAVINKTLSWVMHPLGGKYNSNIPILQKQIQKWRNRTKKILLKVTQLINGRTQAWTQALGLSVQLHGHV